MGKHPEHGQRHGRKYRAGHDQGAADAEPVDQRRRQDRSDSPRGVEGAVEHAEDSREHLFRHGTLQEREAGDVDECQPEPRERDQHECRRRLSPEPDQEDRRAPEDQRETEDEGEPANAHERDRDDPTD